jgi:hypothetical protein
MHSLIPHGTSLTIISSFPPSLNRSSSPQSHIFLLFQCSSY